MDNIFNDKKVKEGFVGQEMITIPPDVLQKISKNHLIRKLYITAIGFYPQASYHDRERKKGSNEYILLYCIKGRGTINLSGKQISLLPNSFYIIPKQVSHHYKSSVTDAWSIYWAHFTGEYADILYQRYLENYENSQNLIPYLNQRVQSLHDILDLISTSFEMRELEIANIRFFELISSMIYRKEISPEVIEGDVVNNSIKFMKENLKSNYAVEVLASQQGISAPHYSRLFRKKIGISPIHYFNQLKIQNSCQYLYFTEKSVKEICLLSGFDDPFYFSRLFKKLMGVSPTAYKLQYKNKVG